MKEPLHISVIIESMDIFATEPRPLIYKRLRTKKAVVRLTQRQKLNF